MTSVLGSILGPLVRWARMRSRVGIAVVGAVPSRDADAWASHRALPIGVPTDATDPRHADLLVVVGRISNKLAPFIVRTHAAMARPTSVLLVELEPLAGAPGGSSGTFDAALHGVPRLYPTVADVAGIIPVDVIVRGLPPSPPAMQRALRALDERTPGVAP